MGHLTATHNVGGNEPPQPQDRPATRGNPGEIRESFGVRKNEPVRIPYEVVGASIRYLRRQKNWRQSDLALYAGVAEGTVSGAELGRRTLLANLDKIARAFGVESRQLVSGEFDKGEDELSDEAIDVARMYLRASSSTKVTIARLLRQELSSIADRFDRLDSTRQEQVTNLITLLETTQGRGRLRSHAPKTATREK